MKNAKRRAAKLYTQKASSSSPDNEINGLDSLGRTSSKIRLRAPRTRPRHWPHEEINELIDNYIGEPVATNTENETFIKKPSSAPIEEPSYDMPDINKSHNDLDYSTLFQSKSIAKSLNLSPSKSAASDSSQTLSLEQIKELHEMNDVEAIDKHNNKLMDEYFSGLQRGIPRTRKSRGLYNFGQPRTTTNGVPSSFSSMKIRLMDPEEAAKIDVFNDTTQNVSETLQEPINQTKQADLKNITGSIKVVPCSSSSDTSKNDVSRVSELDDVKPVPLKFEGVYPDEPLEEPKSTPTLDLKIEPNPVREVESRTAKNKVVRNQEPVDSLSSSKKFNISFPPKYSDEELKKVDKPLIFNLSIPDSKSNETKTTQQDQSSSLEGFIALNDSDKAKKIESILNLVSKDGTGSCDTLDLKNQSKFESEIRENLQRLNELKSQASKNDVSSSNEAMMDKDLEMEMLQNFLRNANETKKREDEQEFRELRAYEWSKIMNDKNAHTFNKNNFFSPIDEQLLKKTVNSALNPNYRNFQSNDDAEALFPKYESQAKSKKTYLTLNSNDLSSPVIESNANPFGLSYKPPALLQLIRELSEDANYKEVVAKIDDLSLNSWKLIGIGHESTLKNKVLVFEKVIDEKAAIRTRRLKFFKTILSATLGFSTVLLIFSVLTDSEVLQYSVDENKNIKKIQ